jgi:hypothetical protein
MLVSEDSRRSRPLVLYGILAKSALSQLNDSRKETDRSAYFQNLIRLIDLYRSDVLNRPAPKAVLDRRPSDPRSVLRERNDAEAVRTALIRAHKIVYPSMTKDEVVEHLKAAFLKISQQRIDELPVIEVMQLKKFLEELTTALKTP